MERTDPSRREQLDELAFALRRRFPAAVGKSTGSLPTRPTGVPAFDRLLPGGGLPLGRLSLLCGSISSGKVSLALAVATEAASGGRPIAWIDVPGSFHPPSAAEAGLDLGRVLLVQPPRGDLEESLHAAVLLLRTGALALLVIDLGVAGLGSSRQGAAQRSPPRIGDETAARLGRAVQSGTSCLCLSDLRPPPAIFRIATLTISLDRRACLWDAAEPKSPGPPRALGGVAVTATILRSRLGGVGRAAELALRRTCPGTRIVPSKGPKVKVMPPAP